MAELLAICATGDVAEGDALRVETPKGDFAVFNVDGAFYVTQNLCTHGPGSLGDGFLEGHEIECDFHQGKFDVRTGLATSAPCSEPLTVYAAVVQDGTVHIDPESGRCGA